MQLYQKPLYRQRRYVADTFCCDRPSTPATKSHIRNPKTLKLKLSNKTRNEPNKTLAPASYGISLNSLLVTNSNGTDGDLTSNP
jgi:hypothetical protein